MIFLSLVVGALAVSRITRLLTEDRLAVGYRRWIVNRFGAESMISYLAHCRWCTSFWVAILVMPPAAIWPNRWVIAAFSAFAASYVAGLLGRLEE